MPKASAIKKKPSSSKASSRLNPINFAQCRISRPSHTEDDWLTEAAAQESSGERYIFGSKSFNHFNNALACYAASIECSPSFPAHYNSARVQLLLSVDFLPRQEAMIANETAIARFASARAAAEGARDQAESTLNHAQSLIEMGVRIEEGILDGSRDASMRMSRYGNGKARERAQVLIEEVETMQRRELDAGIMEVDEEEDGDNLEDIKMSSEEKEALLDQQTTMPQLLETNFASLSNLLELYWAAKSSDDVNPATSLQKRIETAFQTATDVYNLVAASTTFEDCAEVKRELDLLQLQVMAVVLPESRSTIARQYETLVASTGNNNVEIISQYADWIIESLPSSSHTSLEGITSACTDHVTAQHLYQRTFDLLSDPFRSKDGVPAHAFPSLMSSNRVAASGVELGMYACEEDSGSVAAQTAWNRAWEYACKAVECSGNGTKIVGTYEQLREEKIMGATRRLDWKTEVTYLAAMMQLVRCCLVKVGSPGENVAVAKLIIGFARNWIQRDLGMVISRFWDDVEGDFVHENRMRKGETDEKSLWVLISSS